jgi:hypothetical protein
MREVRDGETRRLSPAERGGAAPRSFGRGFSEQWMREGRIPHVETPLGRLLPAAEVERLAAERQQQKSKGGRP